MTTIAVGAFAPIEMVNAASGSNGAYVAETTQQEVVKKSTKATDSHGQSTTAADSHGQSTTAAGSHGQSTTATDGHEQSTAAAGGHGQSTTATDGHGQSTTATDGHGQSTATTIPEMFTSKKALEIEFFSFLSIIGLSLVVPEIFHRPKKEAQKLVIVEKNQAQGQNQAFNEKDLQQYESRDSQQSIQAGLAPTRLINFSQEPETAEENTESKKDLPSLKVVSDVPTPYTIPNKQISQIQINGKTKVDNWSQPNSDAA
ncbi:hypothetical protein [Pleurocapsa sp. CCALA 161]|uniref:hypothetical protein n=1 Tax=Pleurocapsa sp. CCALA 161 TaxID=2107688 RepID=UPI0011B274AB|nr:hypothetical protein [Pleurocapsa sp. CCALA 161]